MSIRRRVYEKHRVDAWIIPFTFLHDPMYTFLSKKRENVHSDSFYLFSSGDVLIHAGITTDEANNNLNPEVWHASKEDDFQTLYWKREPAMANSPKSEEVMTKEDCFKVSKVSQLTEMKEGDVIGKSDLALQIDNKLIQFDFVKNGEEKKKKKIIKPGTWSLTSTQSGLKLEEIVIAKKRLLLDVANTSLIINEAECFFSNLDVYRELERPLKRGVLLYSQPGLGKSATIGHFCDKARTDDPGTAVIIWPTAKIEAYQFEEFLSSESEYDSTVTRVILVLEDIGGGEVECGRRAVDSSLLNLLDGVTVTFSLPTFIIATTNHPDNLLKSLADRPGRFDLMQELLPPTAEERIKLLEFISKRELSQEEKEAVSAKEANTLSIAHLDEIVVRSRLHKKTIIQTLKEILKHRDFMSKNFDRNERTMGLNVSHDDEF